MKWVNFFYVECHFNIDVGDGLEAYHITNNSKGLPKILDWIF